MNYNVLNKLKIPFANKNYYFRNCQTNSY